MVFGKSDSSADVFDNPLNCEGTRLEVAQPRHEDRQSKLAQNTDFTRTVGNIVTTLRWSDYLAVGCCLTRPLVNAYSAANDRH